MNATSSGRSKIKVLAWLGGIVLLIAGLSILIWRHYFHQYTPLDAVKDLRAASEVVAAAEVGPVQNPVHRFMELRYGTMGEAANRERAFLDFFNPGHIEGFYLILGKEPQPWAKALVAETAQIVADYRQSMSSEEKAALTAYFKSDAGRTQVRIAMTYYESKDVRFRSVTSGVINELLTTLSAFQ